MSFLSKLFGTGSEKRLFEKYVPVLEKWSGSRFLARKMLKELIEKARDDARREGTDKLPPNLGDMLLQTESSSEESARVLAKKRKEGVHDQDIRWWGNTEDVERRIIVSIDNLYRFYLFDRNIEVEGMTTDEASANVRKFFPIFGDPDDTTHTAGDDRPLPYELKQRISAYVEKRQFDAEKFKAELERSSSCNAFLRGELRSGRL